MRDARPYPPAVTWTLGSGWDQRERFMRPKLGVLSVLVTLFGILVLWAGTASAIEEPPFGDEEDTTALSGPLDFRDSSGGTNVTECPQAGLRASQSKPLDK